MMKPNTRRAIIAAATVLVLVAGLLALSDTLSAQRRTLYWGTRGRDVRLAQWKLQQWGYYRGAIDGVYGPRMYRAVRWFQARNGLRVDGVVGPQTWRALGFSVARRTAARARATAAGYRGRSGDIDLLARVVAAEARGEPYAGQVAVAAVMLNRVRDPRFPKTLSGVIFQPAALESVSNGLIWQRTPDGTAYKAARDALNGYDPTYGSVFFWNPYKRVSSWIWSRPIVTQIGKHVFAR